MYHYTKQFPCFTGRGIVRCSLEYVYNVSRSSLKTHEGVSVEWVPSQLGNMRNFWRWMVVTFAQECECNHVTKLLASKWQILSCIYLTTKIKHFIGCLWKELHSGSLGSL
jgi:hypothetical protein